MKSKTYILFVASILVIQLSACSSSQSRYVEPGMTGGAGGAAIGAGTGAIIGSVIANGDIASSALLGAGIGLPVGAALAIYLQQQEDQKELRENDRVINYNKDLIIGREAEIARLKRSVTDDSHSLDLNYGNDSEKLYLGPSLSIRH
jgi:mannitol-specific phosphotransferase system IIBC component